MIEYLNTMKNLLDELRDVGLSDDEAKKSLEVVYEWVEERYPVLAAVARSTVRRVINAPTTEESEKDF